MIDVTRLAQAIHAAIVAAATGNSVSQQVVTIQEEFTGLQESFDTLANRMKRLEASVLGDEAALGSLADELLSKAGDGGDPAAGGIVQVQAQEGLTIGVAGIAAGDPGLPEGVTKVDEPDAATTLPAPILAVVVTPDKVDPLHAVDGNGVVVDLDGTPTGQIVTTTDHDLPHDEIAPEHADATPALTVPAEVIGSGNGVAENGSTVVDSQGVPTGEAIDPAHPDAASVSVIPLAPTVPADPDPTATQQD